MRSLLAAQQTFVDRLVQLMKAVQRESGNRKKKVTNDRSHVQKCSKKNQSVHLLYQVQLIVKGWTPVCLQNGLNPSWRTFNKVSETFLRDVCAADVSAAHL